MKALTFLEPGKVKMLDVPTPEPKKGEVLVKVTCAGVCGSDLGVLRSGGGINPISVGFISGHEFAGVRMDTGERVVVDPCTKCGVCLPCRMGNSNVCEHSLVIGGSGTNGAFAEYVAVPEECLIPVPDMDIDDVRLALVEPLAVGLHGVNETRLHGGPVAIFGAGAIGLSTLHELIAKGAREVTLVDLNTDRLAIAEKMGAKVATELPDGPYEVIYDAAGIAATRMTAIQKVMRGGSVILLGAAQKEFDLPAVQLILGNKSMKGSYGYTRPEFVSALYDAASVDTSWVRTIPFADGEDALNEMLAGKADAKTVKLMFRVGE